MNYFKRLLLLTIFSILFFSTFSYAETVTISWAPPEDFKWETYIYAREEGQTFDFNKPVAHAIVDNDVVPTKIDVENLVPGKTYYFVSKHYDPVSKEESIQPSDELKYTVKLPPVKIVTSLPEAVVKNYKMTITITQAE